MIKDEDVPGWHVWRSDKGTLHASRRGPALTLKERWAGLAMTLVASSDDELLKLIEKQAQISDELSVFA